MAEPHIILYDLKLFQTSGLPWSPHTCKTRYALNYKGIPYKTVWLTFPEVHTEIPKITKSDAPPTVPVIVDVLHDNKVVQDSWEIAKYLDETYPDTPKLFNNDIGAQMFLYNYCTKKPLFPIFRLVLPAMLERSGDMRDWFVTTRETFFKTSIDNIIGDSDEQKKALTELLEPIGAILKEYPYLNGEQIAWADIMLAAYLNFFYTLQPDMFDTFVLKDDKAGKEFSEWWGRMEKYMKLEPPSPST
ncbi:hypothetical protein INT45_012311 [Circinella minor]|uniref:GST N-terminal domain-containing protein n=1 Tax=Circinella minor TaxID=1195481 RepID=A0A8H7VL85_9FUNG|nr:hypothetical protein INT45_012311 [Circinella minor]